MQCCVSQTDVLLYRSFAFLVSCTTCILVAIWFLLSVKALPKSPQMKSGNEIMGRLSRGILPIGFYRNHTRKLTTKTPFTTDELNYVLHGEGKKAVSSRDSRYLNYILFLIARPNSYRRRNVVHSFNNHIALAVDRRLKGRRDGFFVECGAADGETWSNTLYLETKRQWNGLLIEANRRYFKRILRRNRQAFVFGGCLSPYRHPATLTFKAAGDQGGLVDHLGTLDNFINRSTNYESTDSIYCVPLEDLLAALGVKRVDFLSLDVQGAELAILQTIDFRTTRIDIIVAETATNESAIALRKFFQETGLYRESASRWQVSETDIMFERSDVT